MLFLVNPYAEPRVATVELSGIAGNLTAIRAIVLTSNSADDVNSFEEPTKITPRDETIVPPDGATLVRTLTPQSLTVLRIASGAR